jgi:hypothetical protein
MLEEAIATWHDAIDRGDLDAARAAVTDPVDASGPRGSGPISAADFAEWTVRSGIRLRPLSWHPVAADRMVVEQDAIWPADRMPVRVATLFGVRDGRVCLVHRFDDLDEALRAARAEVPES